MRKPVLVALALLAAAPATAFAHGGSYAPPVVPGGGGPQVPPGTADPPAAATRWETWWASNKEFYLRLNVEMRVEDGPTSRGSGKAQGPHESAETIRARQDASVRDALVPLFTEALADPSFEVRTAAAIALGKTGSADGSKPLRTAAVKDAHKDVRDSAVIALGLLGRPADIPFLDHVLEDGKENARHRAFAAFALGLIGGEDAAAALLSFADGRPDAPSTFQHEPAALISSTFVAMGLAGNAQVLPTLRRAMVDPLNDQDIRAFASLALGRLKDRESSAEFVHGLRFAMKEPSIRRSAAISLGKIARAEDKLEIESLFAALQSDPDTIVQQFAAISLGGIGGPEITARLEKQFADDKLPQSMSRPFIALALALAHDLDAAPSLRNALATETDESTRSGYCMALGLLGDRESAPLIEKQMSERGRFWLQGYAALALGMMKNYTSADLLFQHLSDQGDPRVRANFAVALGLLHDPRAKTFLVDLLHKQDATVYERGGAAMSMGVLRMNEAVTDIVDVYRNKKEQDLVRAFSVVSLGLIADPAAIPKLSRFAVDNNYMIGADPLNEVLSIL